MAAEKETLSAYVGFRLTESEDAILKEIAAADRRKPSEVVRILVQDFIATNAPKTAKKKTGTSR